MNESRVAGRQAGDQIRVGLIGQGIGHSRTPGMHMAEGRVHGLEYRYDLLDTAEMDRPRIDDLLERAEAEGYRGLNITHPFKQATIAQLDHLSEEAAAIGAVNTVIFEKRRRLGHNTDYWGFRRSLEVALPDANRSRVLLLGAGGAGGAAAKALLDVGVDHLEIYDISTDLASRLSKALGEHRGRDRVCPCLGLENAARHATGIVNATPVGMAGHPGTPLPTDCLQPHQWIADIIYFPLETELLAQARARGCETMDGSAMAVLQAARAFELFTGRKANHIRMRATFDSFGQGGVAP